MPQTHLDDAVLQALQDVMAEEFPQLLETFIADSEERLASLRSGLAEADGAGLRLTAHSFKGSCGNMGAPVLVSLCKQVEDAARQDDLAQVAVLLEQLEREFAIVRILFKGTRRPLA
ncbi:MAG: hypothetical protein GAK45_01639 [Pseudomonas citronellolis]|nr:MAG: hypothetical protein GAK45_01639 [Pseudomonas citronellolis]